MVNADSCILYTCHGSRIHPCRGAAVRGQLPYISSSEKSAVNVFIIHNISVKFLHTVRINVHKQCVQLLYKYNLNCKSKWGGPGL